jgi:hypothetical protein
MASKTAASPGKPSGSLPLYRVLEEEYAHLHPDYAPEEGPSDEEMAELPAGERRQERERRLGAVIDAIHRRKHSALCLSGGGIRSATFALGVLQGLARKNLLSHFDYLSTVSGGGYVGSWLTAWIHRDPEGVKGVTEKLNSQPAQKLVPEQEPVRHLRSYSNYLTPRLGILSGDSWTVAAIVLRNLILNWLVLVPFLLAVLALPRLCVAVVHYRLHETLHALGRGVPVKAFGLWGSIVLAFAAGVAAVTYAGYKRPSSTPKYTSLRGFLWVCLTPLLLSTVLLTTFWAWYRVPDETPKAQLEATWPHYSIPFVIFGAVLYLTAWAAYTLLRRWRRGAFQFKLWELLGALVSGSAGGLLLWLIATQVFAYPTHNVAGPHAEMPHDLLFVTFASPLYLALFFLSAAFFAGISSDRTTDEDREWWARLSAWLLISIAVWVIVSGLVLFGPTLLGRYFGPYWSKYVASAGGLVGLVTALLARSSRSPAGARQAQEGGLSAALMRNALPVGAFVFVALLFALLSYCTDYLLGVITYLFEPNSPDSHPVCVPHVPGWLLNCQGMPWGELGQLHHAPVVAHTPLRLLLVFVLVMLCVGWFFSRYINTNKFSHHAMYRNRLIRAYLGASHGERSPNPFTGFDPADNISMYELRPEFFHTASFKAAGGSGGIGMFLHKLRNKQDEQSIHVRTLLSEDTIRLIEANDKDYYRTSGPGRPLEMALIRDLNERVLLKGDSLHDDAGVFQTFETLDGKAGELLARLKEHEKKSRDKAGEEEKRSQEKKKGKKGGGAVTAEEMVLLNRRLMEAAFPDEFYPCPEPPHKPMPVVNMALNLVQGGENLAWQDRKAESFTVTPLHAGCLQIPNPDDEEGAAGMRVRGSYRPSKEFGGREDGGISLGTAMAISGAAVSPNMGYYSSPLVTFLMTVFNVRLGWWLGNPAKRDYYSVPGPKSSAYPIIAEALSLTDDHNDYIYLSDGGHFENLGLYEMVLRRCHVIVVCDASDDFDFQFDNLGNAIRKVRIDFGIPITFEKMYIQPRSKGQPGAYCAVGTIRYRHADRAAVGDGAEGPPDGYLLYVKPVFYGDEPRDVYHYANTNSRFPHESTADQWFSEAQFESYRMLGLHMLNKILGDGDEPLEISDLVERVKEHLEKKEWEQHGQSPGGPELRPAPATPAATRRIDAHAETVRTEGGGDD